MWIHSGRSADFALIRILQWRVKPPCHPSGPSNTVAGVFHPGEAKLGHSMNRAVLGFTLIELMIVVAIVAILAATALPAYQKYTTRSKLSEALLALAACRTSVTELYQSSDSGPGANNWGCNTMPSKYVAALATDDNGVVTATIAGISADVNGKAVTMIPMATVGTPADVTTDMGSGLQAWSCGGAGTTVDKSYLPSTCRGI